ncbi:MAG: hypothetical protein HQL02_12185 [Nitrospirae bacterium]|nr:hypothetical protein [Nitrospirota bacterium]
MNTKDTMNTKDSNNLSDLIDDYIQRQIETCELLSISEWLEIIRKGKNEVTSGLKGKTLDELED